ncbi:two component, sigma54 specific, transcriptional regulator, Fis family [Desulfacinum hydrothermale DSM 13146]|uniref:Two component, sigma54 specific, transcriptional regulator, Fis family n=1 Tax=Desulfacinum hydrothermale DSM 13146 TaxID=1121390 RepID=A0A1W1XM09_9BACT|nr:sigma-54 dependent transcriptional regulator [Desulfacinum hydrothermale]SMC24892.1 two component, sigma54 specific, transcriptional regulator, Fis family [Desulfacinum hydrothermale DSM 13146]
MTDLTGSRILVVDDERSMREFLEIMLQKDGYEVHCAGNGVEAVELLKERSFDLVITDIRMKPVDGLEVLKQTKSLSPATVVIIISAYASTETAVAAMKEGAYDYLPKPFKIDEMRHVIRSALMSRGQDAPPRPRQGPLYFGCLIGESPAMKRVYELIQKVSATNSNVLITGESGTGKELVAKAIHGQSDRAKKPFIPVNCAGVPESLIESELFGYRRGAFTGAGADRKGLVEAAEGGTLFLDEIGELSPTLQVKLLRVVQEKTIRMVGDTTDIPVDVRIIAATNRDLEQMVIDGRFREDLYYRMNVIQIRLPPLRERREDIPLLADYFLAKFCREFGKDIRKVSSYAMDILKRYDFPGNVRELENIIERGVALESSSIILPESLTLAAHKRAQQDRAEPHGPVLPPEGLDLDAYLADVEKELLVQALERSGGVKQKAAQLLGLSFRSFRYRLAKYSLSSGEEAE